MVCLIAGRSKAGQEDEKAEENGWEQQSTHDCARVAETRQPRLNAHRLELKLHTRTGRQSLATPPAPKRCLALFCPASGPRPVFFSG